MLDWLKDRYKKTNNESNQVQIKLSAPSKPQSKAPPQAQSNDNDIDMTDLPSPVQSPSISIPPAIENNKNNKNNDNFITIKKKKRKNIGKEELSSSLDINLNDLNDLSDDDTEFARPPPNRNSSNRRIVRRNFEESFIQRSRNENKFEQTRSNTRMVVQDIVSSAMPKIMRDPNVLKILAEEKRAKEEAIQLNIALQKGMKDLKKTMVRHLGVMNQNIQKMFHYIKEKNQ